MNKEISVSVVVCTYNPDQTKLFKTLYSVFTQKNIDFEVVLTDDGSNELDKETIRDYFVKNGFENYKLVFNDKNRGTVLNYYAGLKQAKGRYVKVISPGDYLYDENTLRQFYDFCEEGNIEICFGKAATYYEEDGEVKLYPFMAPASVECYKKKDLNEIKYNYFMYKDFIIGANFFCKTELNLKYLEQILNKVIYDEGMAYVLMVRDGIRITYCDEYIVWYEFGYGISSNFSSDRQKILDKDVKTAFDLAANNSNCRIAKAASLFWFGNKNSANLQRIITGIRRRLVKVTTKAYNNYTDVEISKYNRIVSEYDK